MSNILITSDIHLTDNHRDDYRWKLFPFLAEQIEKHNVHYLLCLGDVTETKDGHKSSLVNRVVDEFKWLVDTYKIQLFILKGNHDFIDPNLPYFRFLDSMEDMTFIVK